MNINRMCFVYSSYPKIAVVLFFFVSMTTHGQSEAAERVQELQTRSEKLDYDSQDDFDRAKWYFNVSAGIGSSQYDSEIEQRMDAERLAGGTSPSAGYFDLPGVYRRSNQSGLLYGAVLNFGLEQVAQSWRERTSFGVYTMNTALSGMYFPSMQIGRGWFARADLGYSRILQIRQFVDPVLGGERFDRIHSDALFSQLIFGYGWRAGPKTRLLVHFNGTGSFGAKHRVLALGFNVGFLM